MNLLILALVGAEAVTGLLGLMSGDPDRAFLNDLHAIFGFGILGLLGWKVVLGLNSLKRSSRGRARRATLLLSVLLLLGLGTGLWQSNGIYASFNGTSVMSIHIWIGLAIVPFMAYHSWEYTARYRTGFRADRRAALQLMSAVTVGALAWGDHRERWQGLHVTRLKTALHRFTRTWQLYGQSIPIHILDQ